jgi:hypothetical protein
MDFDSMEPFDERREAYFDGNPIITPRMDIMPSDTLLAI